MGRKAVVAEQLDRSRAAVRFEAPPLPAGPIGEPLLEGEAGKPAAPRAPQSAAGKPSLGPSAPKPAEPESYTNRLLKAKQKVWEEREKDKGKP